MRSLPVLILGAVLALTCVLPAQGFAVTPYGTSCGPTLNGTVQPNGGTYRVAFTISQAAPQNAVLLIVGVNQIDYPLPFAPGCSLLTELAFVQAHRTDPAGQYTWSRAVSSSFQGFARIQFAEVTFDQQFNLNVRTTNGLLLQWN